MSILQENLLSLAVMSLGFLMTMLYADASIRILITIPVSAVCYMWTTMYLPDVRTFLEAAWNARHLSQLSEACEYFARTDKLPQRHYSWYEEWLRCKGDRLGLETWRTYRHYTSPHFVLLYIGGLFVIYLIINYGGRLLNNILDNEPPAIDDLPAPPGGYHMFTYSDIATIQATASSRIGELTRELEASNQREKEHRAGAMISRVLLTAVHRKEASKLKNQLRAEKRQIWELKSPASSSRHSLANALLRTPAQDTVRADRLQDELDVANRKIKDLETAASSLKASRKLTVKFASSAVSNAAEGAEIAKLKADLDEAKKEIEALKTTALSSANTTSKDQELDDENKRLKERLHQLEDESASTQRDLESGKRALERTGSELRCAQQELCSTKKKATEELGKVNDELKKANVHLTSSRRISKNAEERFNNICANAHGIHKKTLKELDGMTSALAAAQVAAVQNEQSMQQLQGQLETLQSQLRTTTAERDQVRQKLDQYAASDPNDLQAKITAAEECIGVLQKELDLKESDIVLNLMDYEEAKNQATEKLEKKHEELAEMQNQLVELRIKLNAEESKIVRLQKDLEVQCNQPVDLRKLRSHPEFVRLQKRLSTTQFGLANAQQDLTNAQAIAQDAKAKLESREEKLVRAKERQSADNEKIIHLLEGLSGARLSLAEKTKGSVAAKQMIEEQGEMISKLQNIDDLF